ncbi:tail protein X [Shinella sp.]|uniref:tail protein X n=1 Tax=Shinella sp. TaxID=1870904 RepID=UPI0039E2E4DB
MTASIIPAAKLQVNVEDATLDHVCYQHLLNILRDRLVAGAVEGYVEATLAANPDLARPNVLLPLGTVVALPEFVIVSTGATVARLWDE